MNFLFDENFPKSARVVLDGKGHAVLDFRQIGKIGAPDETIIKEPPGKNPEETQNDVLTSGHALGS